MVRKVLIFGHSFVHRLESFTHENYLYGWENLGLDGTDVQVEFSGLGGGTLRPGPKCIQRQNHMLAIETYKPHTVFLQIGGNDLSNEGNPEKLARDIISFAGYVITCYNVRHVIIGQLLPRYSERTEVDYNDKVILVNKYIKQSLMQRHNITYWHHYGLWKNIQSLLAVDKVHLNPQGMRVYAKNVRAAVGSTKRC